MIFGKKATVKALYIIIPLAVFAVFLIVIPGSFNIFKTTSEQTQSCSSPAFGVDKVGVCKTKAECQVDFIAGPCSEGMVCCFSEDKKSKSLDAEDMKKKHCVCEYEDDSIDVYSFEDEKTCSSSCKASTFSKAYGIKCKETSCQSKEKLTQATACVIPKERILSPIGYDCFETKEACDEETERLCPKEQYPRGCECKEKVEWVKDPCPGDHNSWAIYTKVTEENKKIDFTVSCHPDVLSCVNEKRGDKCEHCKLNTETCN